MPPKFIKNLSVSIPDNNKNLYNEDYNEDYNEKKIEELYNYNENYNEENIEELDSYNDNEENIEELDSYNDNEENIEELDNCNDIITKFFNSETDYGKKCGKEGCIYFKKGKNIGLKVTKKIKAPIIEDLYNFIIKLNDKSNYKNNLEDFIIIPKNLSKNNKCNIYNDRKSNYEVKSYYSFNYYYNAIDLVSVIKNINKKIENINFYKKITDKQKKSMKKYKTMIDGIKEQLDFIMKHLNKTYNIYHNDIHPANLIVVNTEEPIILRDNYGSEKILNTKHKVFLIDFEHLSSEEAKPLQLNSPCNEYFMDREDCIDYLIK